MPVEAARTFRVIIIALTMTVLLLVTSAWLSGYNGRQKLVEVQRAGCERARLDRRDNATGWRIAEAARLADQQFSVAKRYGAIAAELEARSRIDCGQEFPDARLFGF